MRKMKDSGIEWIGEIPESWSVWKVKHLGSCPMQYGANATGIEFDVSLPRYVRITDITQKRILSDEGKQSLPIDTAKEYILDEGDILFARSGATAGKSFYYKADYGMCAFAGYLIRFKTDQKKANSKFLYYYTLTQAYEEWSQQIFIQATIQNISAEKYNGLCFAIPESLEQQNRIVDYLDKKCAEIDVLIEAKEKANALHKELRQSVIYEAVTKGLDPDVPMKDSGIEWIGEIPESWSVKKVKYCARLNQNKLSESIDFDYEFKYIDISSVTEAGGIKQIIELTFGKSPSRARMIVNDGDTIISTVRTYLKAIAFIQNAKDLICSTGFCVVSPMKEIMNPYFCYYALQSDYFIQNVVSKSTGVSYPAIASGDIGNMQVCVPTIEEQDKIIAHLNLRCERINSLIDANNSTIEKLKEYRKSVIFEAVTGKVEL